MQFCTPLRHGQRSLPRGLPAAFATSTRSLGGLLACGTIAGGHMTAMQRLLEVSGLKKHFPIYKGVFARASGQVYAVDGISFHIERGETLGLVGGSGCGKSNVGRTLPKLIEPTAGTIRINGTDITNLDAGQM